MDEEQIEMGYETGRPISRWAAAKGSKKVGGDEDPKCTPCSLSTPIHISLLLPLPSIAFSYVHSWSAYFYIRLLHLISSIWPFSGTSFRNLLYHFVHDPLTTFTVPDLVIFGLKSIRIFKSIVIVRIHNDIFDLYRTW
jgi:hypothetical protein